MKFILKVHAGVSVELFLIMEDVKFVQLTPRSIKMQQTVSVLPTSTFIPSVKMPVKHVNLDHTPMLIELNVHVFSITKEMLKENVYLIVEIMKNILKLQTDANVLLDTKDKIRSVSLTVKQMKNMLEANVSVSVEPSLTTVDVKFVQLTPRSIKMQQTVSVLLTSTFIPSVKTLVKHVRPDLIQMQIELNAIAFSITKEMLKENVYLTVETTKNILKSQSDANVLTDMKDKTWIHLVSSDVEQISSGKTETVFVWLDIIGTKTNVDLVLKIPSQTQHKPAVSARMQIKFTK